MPKFEYSFYKGIRWEATFAAIEYAVQTSETAISRSRQGAPKGAVNNQSDVRTGI